MTDTNKTLSDRIDDALIKIARARRSTATFDRHRSLYVRVAREHGAHSAPVEGCMLALSEAAWESAGQLNVVHLPIRGEWVPVVMTDSGEKVFSGDPSVSRMAALVSALENSPMTRPEGAQSAGGDSRAMGRALGSIWCEVHGKEWDGCALYPHIPASSVADAVQRRLSSYESLSLQLAALAHRADGAGVAEDLTVEVEGT